MDLTDHDVVATLLYGSPEEVEAVIAAGRENRT